VLVWLSVWGEVQMTCVWSSWCHCHPIISCSSKIQYGLPFCCRLIQVVLEKRPLNGCSSSSRVAIKHARVCVLMCMRECTYKQQQSFYVPLSGTTRVSQYQKKHSPTRHPDHHPIFIIFFHLLRSIASSLFKLHAWQSFCTTSFHVLFSLPLGLESSTSYSIHFFTQSVSSFCSTCPYHHNLFCCNINIISSILSLSLISLLGTLFFTITLHIHLTSQCFTAYQIFCIVT